MHDELNRVTSKPAYKEMNFDKLSIAEQSQKWQDYFEKKDNSIMSDVFGGQLMNRLQCLSCKHNTLAFDNFMDLSIEIPRKAVRITGAVSLSDCLDKFVETERMIDCGYKC
jgi:ubiquitin carboxyl-terminal hydrolase 4/11/15